MYKKVLIAADDSPPAKEAFLTALRLSEQLGATLTVVHAGSAGDGFSKVVEGWCRQHPGAVAMPEILPAGPGNPARGIIELLKTMRWDFLVIGTHGRHGAALALLGSVAEDVLRHSPIPVVVVRPEAA